MTFQVAATLSRVAEAEWLRTAEGLRRFCPLIGQLGEWKAFCEGGWIGPVPGDLPDVDQMPDPPREMQDAGPSAKEFGWSITLPRKVDFTELTLRRVSCLTATPACSRAFNDRIAEATPGRI